MPPCRSAVRRISWGHAGAARLGGAAGDFGGWGANDESSWPQDQGRKGPPCQGVAAATLPETPVLVGKLGRFDGQAGDCSRGVGESLAVALPSWLWPCGVGCGPTERARLLGCGVLSLEQGSLRGEGQIRGCHARWRPLYTGRPATPANSARYLGRICRLSEGIRGWHRVDEAARASGR
jgi:hypothetical protein